MDKLVIGILCCILIGACGTPKAAFHLEDSEVFVMDSVMIDNLSSRGDRYVWNFGEALVADDESNATYVYFKSGVYPITLYAYQGDKVDSMTKHVVVKPVEHCHVLLSTSMGDIVLKLYDDTPRHRDNFIKLVNKGYYDKQLFHRVINGFMIQAGDPESKGAAPGKALGGGGPGYTIPAEISEEHVHVSGALAAARLGDKQNPQKASSGSQFYIVSGRPLEREAVELMAQKRGVKYTEKHINDYVTKGGAPQLDGSYTIFGEVVSGMDVVAKIARQETNNLDRPKVDIPIKMIEIR